MMDRAERKAHWEHIYQTKELSAVSWYQPRPQTSLDLIAQFALSPEAKIIDVGGGDSLLVDHLLQEGYGNVTVLDISEAAINRAKARLGEAADRVRWIVRDITTFRPEEQYDCWHDRAAFHFLTGEQDIAGYLEAAREGIVPGGALVVGTFSESGPGKCSGITVKQYNEAAMTRCFAPSFRKVSCLTTVHETPFATEQQFLFCSFRKV